MSYERWQKVVEHFQMMAECGACEDEEHDDCSHPQGSVQVAVDEWKPVCCCRDHPLIAVVEELDDENERLRAVLSALCDATTAPCTCDWWSRDVAEHSGTCAIWAYRSALAAAASVLGGET